MWTCKLNVKYYNAFSFVLSENVCKCIVPKCAFRKNKSLHFILSSMRHVIQWVVPCDSFCDKGLQGLIT